MVLNLAVVSWVHLGSRVEVMASTGVVGITDIYAFKYSNNSHPIKNQMKKIMIKPYRLVGFALF